MTDTRRCPQCGAELAADAPEGLCPQCLLIHGIETQPPSDSQGAAGSAPGRAYSGPFTAPTPQELAKHFPQLEIIELLGQGGMGAVYKARQPGLDRLVAVKILPPAAARDPAFAERFAREARALAKLNHPNIVAVYDFGQTLGRVGQVFAAPQPQPEAGTVGREDLAHSTPAEGLYYFIMEFVDGVNLRELIRSGQCKPEEALRIVPLICEALQFAHDEGIVHRDIKPENILLDKRGRLKIADFGLAKLLGHTRTDYTLTGPWQVMGTPNYMAPEQMDDPLKVDHRADIYSLGVVFYEMLTGELPRGRFAPPSQKVQVDVRLDEVVLRALEQDVERRYQHASEVKTDVESISGMVEKLPATMRRAFGFEWRSKAELFGLPLVHISTGQDPTTGRMRVSKGIIAIGDKAKGVIAIGGAATGVVAFGGFSMGVLAFGGASIGLFSFGGFALALIFACGGIALAPYTFGGIAFGYVAVGGLPFGVHAAGGPANDLVAQQFFSRFHLWTIWLWSMGISLVSIAVLIGAQAWARRRDWAASRADGKTRTVPVSLPHTSSEPPAVNAAPGKRPFALTLFGILNILVGTLLTVLMAVDLFSSEGFRGMFPESVQGEPLFRAWMAVAPPLQYLATNVLLVAGIGLLLVKRWGRTASLGFSFFKIGMFVIELPLYMMFWIIPLVAEAKAQGPEAASAAATIAVLPVALPIIFCFELFYPILLLVILQRPNVSAAFQAQIRSSAESQVPAEGAQTRPQPPVKASKLQRVLVILVLLLALAWIGQAMILQWRGTTPGRGTAGQFRFESDGPVVSEEIIQTLDLKPIQVREVNKLIQAAYREYQPLETQHTRVRKDDQGRVHVTIAPFQDALRGIEKQLWDGLDNILDERQRDVARRQLPIGNLLRQGRGEVTIEIWHDKGKYHYDEFDSGRGVGMGTAGLGSDKLPEKYKRYWQQAGEPSDQER